MDIISNYYYILAVLLLLVCFMPLLIYLRYGREPKIQYNPNYEVDFPTDDPPAIVNAICSGLSKKAGEPDINGFTATIMDLIDRNYLFLVNKELKDADSNSVFLKINSDYDPDTLWDFEETVIIFLREYEQNGIISVDMIFENINSYDSAEFFKETYKTWKKEVNIVLWNGNLKEAFSNEGDRYLKIFGISGLIFSVLAVYVTFIALPGRLSILAGFPVYLLILSLVIGLPLKIIFPNKEALHNVVVYGLMGLTMIVTLLFEASITLTAFRALFFSSIVLGMISVVSIMLPEKIAGQWTEYGQEYISKWSSFKKYVEDFSLMKEYPPESVKVWNKYLVYATALGAADGVRKAMELSIPNDKLDGNDLYNIHYHYMPTSFFNNAIDIALGRD